MLLCTGGYGNAYYLSTYARGSNVTATWRAHRRGLFFESLFYADSSDLHSCVWRLSVEIDPDVGVAQERWAVLGA